MCSNSYYICQLIYLPTYVFIFLSAYLSTYLEFHHLISFSYLSVYLHHVCIIFNSLVAIGGLLYHIRSYGLEVKVLKDTVVSMQMPVELTVPPHSIQGSASLV